MNTTFEPVILEVTEPTTANQHLGLNDVSAALEGGCNFMCFFGCVGHISDWDRYLVRVQQGTGLVLMELHSSQRQRIAVNERFVKELLGKHLRIIISSAAD